jgi:hypothetical protein
LASDILLFSVLLRFLAGYLAIIRAVRQQANGVSPVIATSACDEAIHFAEKEVIDCFAAFAATSRECCRSATATPYST